MRILQPRILAFTCLLVRASPKPHSEAGFATVNPGHAVEHDTPDAAAPDWTTRPSRPPPEEPGDGRANPVSSAMAPPHRAHGPFCERCSVAPTACATPCLAAGASRAGLRRTPPTWGSKGLKPPMTEERASVRPQGEASHQAPRDGKTGGSHATAESNLARLGAVPPPGGRPGDVQQTRLATLVAVDALGTSQTPEEDSDMGDRKVLVDHRVRYADDFVITAVSQDLLANEVWPWVEAFLAQRGLRLSPANTRFHTH